MKAIDDVLGVCANINPADIPRGMPEVRLALDVRTMAARFLEKAAHRDYKSVGEHEIPGTADLIVPPENRPENQWLVIDWKTGYENIPKASDSLQLAFFAVCLADIYAVDCVDVAIGRIRGDGEITYDVHMLDSIGIDEARRTIASAFAATLLARENATVGVYDVAPGVNCKYCPATLSCPVYETGVTEIVNISQSLTPWVDKVRQELSSPVQAAVWYDRVRIAETVLEEVRRLLREEIQKKPLTLQDGSTVKLVSENRRKIDGKLALKVLQEKFGQDIANAASDVKITQKSLATACGSLTPQVMEHLVNAGAVSTVTLQTLKTYKARK